MTEPNARHIEELTERLSAYIDGELGEEECREVEATLARDATARRVLAELRTLSQAVGSLPVEPGPADIKERVLRSLERQQLLEGGVGAPAEGEAPESRPGWRLFQLLASAAIVALAVGVGYYVTLSVWEPEGDLSLARHEKSEPAIPQPRGESAAKDTLMVAKGGEPDLKRLEVPAEPESLAGAAAPTGAPAERIAKGAPPSVSAKSMPGVEPGVRRQVEPPFGRGFEEPAVTAHFGVGGAEVIYPEQLTETKFDDVQDQLTITVADHAAEQAVVEQVTQFFVANSLSNARELPPKLQVARTQALYVEAEPGINTADLDSQQYLVRATPAELDGLVTQVCSVVPCATIGRTAGGWSPAPLARYAWAEPVVAHAPPTVGKAGELEEAAGKVSKEGAPAQMRRRGLQGARPSEAATQPSIANVAVQITSAADREARDEATQAEAAQRQILDATQQEVLGEERTPQAGVEAQQMDTGSARQVQQGGRGAVPTQGPPQELINVVVKVTVAKPATQASSQPSE